LRVVAFASQARVVHLSLLAHIAHLKAIAIALQDRLFAQIWMLMDMAFARTVV
jgi:GTP cyclohydrolase I